MTGYHNGLSQYNPNYDDINLLLYHLESFVIIRYFISTFTCKSFKNIPHARKIWHSSYDLRFNLDEIMIVPMMPIITTIPIAELNSGIDGVLSVKSFNAFRIDLSYNIA